MPHTYKIDDEDFDLEDDLRPEYDFAALREADRVGALNIVARSCDWNLTLPLSSLTPRRSIRRCGN